MALNPLSPEGSGAPVAEHIYNDAAGHPVHSVRRYHRPDPERPKGYKKACIPYHWTEDGWEIGLDEDAPRLLYNLDKITNAPGERVVWVEGENVADRLNMLGILATTSLGGTGGKNKLPDLSPLKGRLVPILPDHDEPGKSYAEHVLVRLKEAGAKPFIQPDLPLPPQTTLPEGYDVVDVLDAGIPLDKLLPYLEPPSLNSGRFPLLSVRELLTLKSPVWQVEGFIQEACLFMLFGEASNGKSFIAMDLLMNLCGPGTHWCGKEMKKQGPVVFVNADGGMAFRDRVAAWHTANAADPEDYRFFTLNLTLPIWDRGSILEFSAKLDMLTQHLGEAPVAMVIDTYSRCNAGQDENGQADSSAVVANLDYFRAEYSCSVGLIHHTDAKGIGPRGSSVLPGAIDSSWKVTKTADEIRCDCVKQRNGKDLVPPLLFELRRVPGTDQVALFSREAAGMLTTADQQDRVVVRYLERHPDSTAKEIQEFLALSQARTSEIIVRLVDLKVIDHGPRRLHPSTGQGVRTFRLANQTGNGL